MARKSQELARRHRLNRSMKLETLGERSLMAADTAFVQESVITTPAEQMIIELINRARANPMLEADRLGVELNSNLPPNAITTDAKQPLAPNESLLEASRAHSADMVTRGFFAHTNPDGATPSDRAIAAGYSRGAGENIAYDYKPEINQSAVESAHALFFGSAPHRQNFFNANYDDIGIGFALSPANGAPYSRMYTTEKFRIGDSASVLTGVAFDDGIIDDDFYSMGEGWSGINIEATDVQGRTYSTLTNEAGGYNLVLPAGTYRVVATHPNGLVTRARTVEIGRENVKLDFTSDQFAEPTFSTVYKKDINGDGIVTPLDALQVINRINRAAPYDIKYDVNGDGKVTPIDVLVIVNELNSPKEAKVTSPMLTAAPSTNLNDIGQGNVLVSETSVDQHGDNIAADNQFEELAAEVGHAKDTVGAWLRVASEELEVESARYVTFTNTGLGIADRVTGQAFTEGYQIVIRYRTAMYEFRGTMGSSPVFIRYASINEYIGEEEEYCCPWETLGQHCLDAIDAAIEDLSYGIVGE